MSIVMKNTNFGPRALEIQWLNCIVTTHGMICGCEDPWNHLKNTFKNHKIRCLFIGETDTTDAAVNTGEEDAVDLLQPGELDALFAEDMPDESG